VITNILQDVKADWLLSMNPLEDSVEGFVGQTQAGSGRDVEVLEQVDVELRRNGGEGWTGRSGGCGKSADEHGGIR
jgi:hypothetical protein